MVGVGAVQVEGVAKVRAGQEAAQPHHPQSHAKERRQLDELVAVAGGLERPELVAQMRQKAERHVRKGDDEDGPPGMVEGRPGVERLRQLGVLGGKVRPHAREAAVYAGREEGEGNDRHRQQQHQEALDAVGEDVRMGAAQDHIEEQHDGGDAEGPGGVQPQHDFKHHQAGHQLPGQIEEENQGQKRHQHPHPF